MSKLSCGELKKKFPAVSSALESVYDARAVPHAALRVPSDSVKPLNHESPIDSYRLMFPRFGFGRPRLGTPSASASAAVSVGTFTLRDMRIPRPRKCE